MLDQSQSGVIVFFALVIILVLLLCVFIILIMYRYQRRQMAYFLSMEELKSTYTSTLMQSQLEMQEQTFQNIAAEIHDNAGQKLTLAKLYLNTCVKDTSGHVRGSIESSLLLLSEIMQILSDISRGMSVDLLVQNGLTKSIENELLKLGRTKLYSYTYRITGDEVFLNNTAELIVFRIVQECINNFVKHANGTHLELDLIYTKAHLEMIICDNGVGFSPDKQKEGIGLFNLKKRVQMIHGKLEINGEKGTRISIKIPLAQNKTNESGSNEV